MPVPSLLSHRLSAQGLAAPLFNDPVTTVRHSVALQAQDYAMSLWAVGARTQGATRSSVEGALDEGSLLRTHLLRPTWHLVAAEDIRWLLRLSAPQIQKAMSSMNRTLGLEQTHFRKARKLLEKALAAGALTREELRPLLERARISTDENRLAHLLTDAELQGLICNGPRRGKQGSFALLDQRVPAAGIQFEGLEAAAELARRYFRSRGPASLADFTWWSGLPAGMARSAFEEIRKDLAAWPGAPALFFYPDMQTAKSPALLLLPAFDEYLIAYRDRSAQIDEQHRAAAFTSNGIFRPLLVHQGRVAATWRAEATRSGVRLQMQPLPGVKQPGRRALAEIARSYGRFLESPVEFSRV